MRKVLAAAVMSAFLFMGAMCSTDLPAFIAAVQANTVKVCSFVPTAETIAAIVAANNPALATVEALVAAVCAAVTPKTAAEASTPRTIPVGASVAGVPIVGHFVVK